MLRSYALLARDLSVLRGVAFRFSALPTRFLSGRRWASTVTKTKEEDCHLDTNVRGASATSKNAAAAEGQEGVDEPLKRKHGRPRKSPAVVERPTRKEVRLRKRPGEVTAVDSEQKASSSTPRGRTKKSASDIPPRLTAHASPHHHNLTTFLRYARNKDPRLNPASNVYRGTHYEYTCICTLSAKTYNFQLYRSGRANDLGVDLVGLWKLPTLPFPPTGDDGVKTKNHAGHTGATDEDNGEPKKKRKQYRHLKVLAQCKLTTTARPQPSMIRELEGAYAGAPAGWQAEDNTLALLLTTAPATPGVIAALQRSRWPMGFLQITVEGEVKQFLWNGVAREKCGLESWGVVVRYSSDCGDQLADRAKKRMEGQKKRHDVYAETGAEVKQNVRLSWMGRVWRADYQGGS